MLGGKRAGVESCTSICVQLLEAGVVRAWGMSCICGGIASIGRPDADVGRLARGRSAVAHALKNVRRDCRGKPARQLPARPYVVAVDEGWAAGFVCRRVITGAGGNDVHGGIVDQPCIGDRILTPRGCLGRPGVYRTEALGIAHELQSFICDGAAAAGRPGGVAINQRLLTGSGDRARATLAFAGPAACAVETMKDGKRSRRRMKIRTRAGRGGARDSMVLLSLKPAKPSAAVAISRWQRRSNS